MNPQISSTVLIVNEVSGQMEMLEKLFSQSGYFVLTALDGKSGFEIVQKQKIDLIICDTSLPTENGLELCHLIRNNEQNAEIPILLIGGLQKDVGVIIESLEAGADDFIEMPIEPLHLLARAERLIEKKRTNDLLKESESYFRSLIDNVSDIISILSFDGTILYESPSVKQVLGHEQSFIIGKNAFDFIHPEDRDRIVKYFYEYAKKFGESTSPIEYRFRDKDNSWRLLESVGKVIIHPSKGFIAVINSRDVTERRKSESALRDSEEKFRKVLENSLDVVYQINLKTKAFDYMSRAAKILSGYEAEKFVAEGFDFSHSLVHPDDLGKVEDSLKNAISDYKNGKTEHSIEYRLNTKHKGYRWVKENRAIIEDGNNEPVAIIATARDITDQKDFEASLHFQKTLLESQTEASMDGILAVTEKGEIISHNQRFVEMWGIPDEILQTKSDKQAVSAILDQLVKPQEFIDTIEFLYQHSRETHQTEIKLLDGRIFERYSSPIKDANDKYFGRVWFFRDISSRKQTENALLESEDRYRDIVENSQDLVCTHDLNGNILSVNKTVEKALGFDRNILMKLNVRDILIPEVQNGFDLYLAEIREKGVARGLMYVKSFDGETRVWEFNNTLRTEGVAEPIVRGMATDISERKRIEDNLRESEERFRNLADTAPVWIWIAGIDRRCSYANKTFLDFTGNTLESEIQIGWKRIHPEDLEKCRKIYFEAFENREEYSLEYRHQRFDGEYRWVLLIGVPRWTPNGIFLGYIGSGIDIHERRQSEEALRKTEEKLRQAQKLESVGRLAGGIAHDFNNMLTAIIGYSDISLKKLDSDDPLKRNIEEIKKAADRSASLTSQLLAFSRQQVLQTKVVAFNELITDTFKMLQRLIGENIHLNVNLDPQAGMIEADPGQLTQVIVNLAVNARDAMPDGGVLTIKTESINYDEKVPISSDSIRFGRYVLLTVQDNGIGIESENLSQVFEPFFTTKEIGKGTGLGLSTVYGIVKQSSGEILVESEVGVGTTFKLYLPCVKKEKVAEVKTPTEKGFIKGTETILIVEDESMVRNLTREVLEECGYTIIEAKNGVEAFEICKELNGKIDLVITDVVMPQMSGLELSQQLMQIFPHLPILYTSGYTDETIALDNLLKSGNKFIKKPFVPENIAKQVRDLLDKEKKSSTISPQMEIKK